MKRFHPFFVSLFAVLVFICLAWSGRASAETIAATLTSGGFSCAEAYGTTTTGPYSPDRASACVATAALVIAHYTGGAKGAAADYITTTGGSGSLGVCTWQSNGAGGMSGYNTCNYYSGSYYACPAGQGWTASGSNCTRPDCVSPQIRNTGNGSCQSGCTSTANASSANTWYSIGATESEAAVAWVGCSSSCKSYLVLDNPKFGYFMTAGVKTYGVSGHYVYYGLGANDQCGATGQLTAAMPTGASSPPTSTCPAGSVVATVEGALSCVAASTGLGGGASPCTTSTVYTAVGQTITSVATDSCTGKVVTNSVTYATGVTPPVSPASSVGPSASGTDAQAVVSGVAASGGTFDKTGLATDAELGVLHSDLTGGTVVSGALPAQHALATDDTRTMNSIWAARYTALQATPLFSVVSSLTSFPFATGGTCPSWTLSGTVFGVAAGGSVSPPCLIWPVLRVMLMLTALFVARRLIFGG